MQLTLVFSTAVWCKTSRSTIQGRLSIQGPEVFLTCAKWQPSLTKTNTSYSNVPTWRQRNQKLLTTFLVECNQIPGYSRCLWMWILILLHFPFSLDEEQQQKAGLARSVMDAAYADSGLALDFYTGFDANWNEPACPVQGFDVLWSLYKQTI